VTDNNVEKGRLIVTRKVDEKVCIGEDIEVKVTDIKGTRVKLSVSAPLGLPVVRGEVKLAPSKCKL
jgi:carbon storage regulator